MRHFFNKLSNIEDYRVALTFAILLHAILFISLFIHLTHLRPAALPNHSAMIQATLVETSVKTLPSPPLPMQTSAAALPQTKKNLEAKTLTVEKSPVQLPIKDQKHTPLDEKTNKVKIKKIKPKFIPKKTINKAKTLKTNLAKKKMLPKTVKKTDHKALRIAQKNIQQLLQQEILKSRSKSTTHHSAINTAKIRKYQQLILQAIAEQWIIPPDVDKSLETKLSVQLSSSGRVLNVDIIKNSGNPVLDRSAQTAVYKASPLPLPKEKSLLSQFRQLNLTVRPEGLLT